MYAKICFPFSLDQTFTYEVPSNFDSYINAGTLVNVLFKQRPCVGFIVSTSFSTNFTGRLNKILSINHNTCIPDELWKTLEWSSQYYITPIGKVTQIALSWIFKKKISQKKAD